MNNRAWMAGGFGPPVPNSAYQSLRYRAAMAAIAIEGKPSAWSIATLADVVGDSKADYASRRSAAIEIRRYDPKALKKAVPALIRQIINQPNPNLRRLDVDLLMEIDPKSLEKALGTGDDAEPEP